jgi:hypothetical protein
MLPDEVFLDIFDFYRTCCLDSSLTPFQWNWLLLVHVCRRWRQIVFESSRRLDLQIFCTYGRPSWKNLVMWPDLPIAVDCYFPVPYYHEAIRVAHALEYSDRICSFRLNLPEPLLKKMVTAMQKPFLALRYLFINSIIGTPFILDDFLGGSAPCLQAIVMYRISFPGLPTLLSSTKDLVDLYLDDIPPTGYISPVAMTVCLAELPRLKTLFFFFWTKTLGILFKSAIFCLDRIQPPPIILRDVLPALTVFRFAGSSKYLEALVVRIDSPQLNHIFISLMDPVADIQVVQLSKFFDRSAFTHTKVRIYTIGVGFDMYLPTNYPGSDWPAASTIISCRESDCQVSRISQVVSKFSAILFTAVYLRLVTDFWSSPSRPLSDEDGREWLQLFHQFPTMQALFVSRQFAVRIASALKSITGEEVVEALSSLDLICLEDQPTSSVEKFIAVRQFSDRPVSVVGTDVEFDQRLKPFVGK